ncbi:cold-shock protein [Agrobacterium sp. a22-2]|uniref:cold-shock protein n=1 Tax=Agrobacterium sp. a22-2 TaxID=2283840 RepID=UPI0014476F18|nr:cold-shock protein [Agrobacterium sp. a22-2]NKN36886.1 cold-shock protein [Agrobacterium sp. a22-2]
MSRHLYKAGDHIVLKDGPVRTAKPSGDCRILAAMPESQGSRRYRIRFDTENFDRSIAEDEIDSGRSPTTGSTPSPNIKGTGTWLKASSVRTKK